MEDNNHSEFIDQSISDLDHGFTSKLLSISLTSGIPLYEKKFDDTFKYKGQLFTIGINALRVFLLDSFRRVNISSIKVDELTLRMVNIDDVIVYYVYTGDSEVHEKRFTDFLERLTTMDCWRRFSESEYNIYEKDTKSISLIVEEIFAE
ncbi:MAG: hypothetical protein HeimC2_21540 [Candidatus Heimdallarchaeota archaeon LC_2]|nr:MAG: hypothetical protein HeimC2_21540 [Candidatus Heimdallarchaeota archaeon LC_2]